MSKYSVFFIFCSFIFVSINPTFAAQETNSEVTSEQRYVYGVYYKKFSVGKMTQQYQKQGNEIKVKSQADLSFMFYSFGGTQQSDIYWDAQQKLFLNHSFSRETVGFGATKMEAKFDNKNYKTDVLNSGKEEEYQNKRSAIVGFNSINLQISEGLKAGKQDFEFYMQTSDDISHYFFQVKGKETIETKFGNIEAYRVEQIKKSDRTFITWFAADFNYQMVKFEYKRKILDIRGELIDFQS